MVYVIESVKMYVLYITYNTYCKMYYVYVKTRKNDTITFQNRRRFTRKK